MIQITFTGESRFELEERMLEYLGRRIRDSKLEKILEAKIEALELSARTHRCLRDSGIRTVGDIYHSGRISLMRIPGFGRGCMKELDDIFASWGAKIPDGNSGVSHD